MPVSRRLIASLCLALGVTIAACHPGAHGHATTPALTVMLTEHCDSGPVATPTTMARLAVRARSLPPLDSTTGMVAGVVGAAPEGQMLRSIVRLRRDTAGAPDWEWRQATDSAGQFLFAALRPGRYVLRVTALGYLGQSIPVTMQGHHAVTLVIAMRRYQCVGD